jgi:hypothetical protein
LLQYSKCVVTTNTWATEKVSECQSATDLQHSCSLHHLITNTYQGSAQFCIGFVWQKLNKHMNKQEQQYQIRVRSLRDTNATDKWLQQRGLDAETFATTDALHLKAQAAARRILTVCSEHKQLELLDSKHAAVLNDYLKCMHHKRKRARLSDKRAYQVLNICSRANKRLFKQHRQNTH